MKSPEHDVASLIRTILSTGWMDQDVILVGYHPKLKKYFVMEGNRRITALRMIKEDVDAGYKTMKQVPHGKDIQSFWKKLPAKGAITVVNGGDATKWTEEHWLQIKQYLANRHITGQKSWGPFQSAYNIYIDYMHLLSETEQGKADGVSIDNKKSFYIENDIVQEVKNKYGLTLQNTKNSLYLVSMRDQIAEKLLDLGGGDFPEKKTALINEGILKSVPLKKRYGFDTENGRISRGDEYLDLFVKLCFDYGDNKALITAATAGDSNLRTYSYVLDKDPSKDQRFIDMIEKEGKTPDEAKSDLLQQRGDFKLIEILQKVKKLIGSPRLDQLSKSDLESDTLRELIEYCTSKFDQLKKNLEDY
tara:strand:- start:178 stop:1260 length:1083 start_codon:yes stop_codon:yes gene_type:complete